MVVCVTVVPSGRLVVVVVILSRIAVEVDAGERRIISQKNCGRKPFAHTPVHLAYTKTTMSEPVSSQELSTEAALRAYQQEQSESGAPTLHVAPSVREDVGRKAPSRPYW